MSKDLFFPKKSHLSSVSKDKEIGVRELFGSRIYTGQSILETLCEFLNVVKSDKKFDLSDVENPDPLPEFFPSLPEKDIQNLTYFAEDKLNLKLFSLYLSSKSSSIHESHEYHYNEIKDKLKSKISILDNSKDLDDDKVLDILENLFMGFQGVGVNRDWCAQSFLPINKELLSGETIWKATKAKKDNFRGTNIIDAHKYFERSSHIIYARGGEVLYLEMFLAFEKSKAEIEKLTNEEFKDIYFSKSELDPKILKSEIVAGLEKLLNSENLKVLGNLAKFVDTIDNSLKFENKKENNIGWIPKENWKFGYIFAVELNRIFKNNFDIIESLEVIQILIVLQTIRRFNFKSSSILRKEKPLMAVIDANCPYSDVKDLSNSSYMQCLLNIKDVISQTVNVAASMKSIDSDYGSGVFKKLSKVIGFVVPRTGTSEKFVLTNDMLNCLIATTLLPDEKITLETFLKELKLRYGIVFDNKGFNEINNRRGKRQMITRSDTLDWLIEMLDESGYLIQLSDYLSLVKNSPNNN